MAQYVDGYVLPVPRKGVAHYSRIASTAAKVWREHGALDYRECVADDLKIVKGNALRYDRMVKLKAGETVVFAYVVFKSRAHRDKVNAKVFADPRIHASMPSDPKKYPFDMKRMAVGGFRTIVGR